LWGKTEKTAIKRETWENKKSAIKNTTYLKDGRTQYTEN
jgi:hypothetical protein